MLWGNDAVIFADPPYKIARNHLYGYNGELHRTFDHQAFAMRMKSCHNPWLITYNDCEDIRTWFADFEMTPLGLQYTLRTTLMGQELIITNYDPAITSLSQVRKAQIIAWHPQDNK